MNPTAEAITIFLVLVPGFVSSLLLSLLSVRRPITPFELLIEALVFSFIIYSLSGLLRTEGLITFLVSTEGAVTTYTLKPNSYGLAITAILSILIPIALSALQRTDIHMTFFRWLGVTHKTSRTNTWVDVFSDQRRYIVVTLNDGRRLSGWPLYYSNDAAEGLIYLSDPAWIDNQGTVIELSNVHGVFLVKREDLRFIEFQHRTSEGAIVYNPPRMTNE